MIQGFIFSKHLSLCVSRKRYVHSNTPVYVRGVKKGYGINARDRAPRCNIHGKKRWCKRKVNELQALLEICHCW